MGKSPVDEILGPVHSDGPKEAEGGDELTMISQELIDAVHAKKPDDVAEALKAAFELMDTDDENDDRDESHEG